MSDINSPVRAVDFWTTKAEYEFVERIKVLGAQAGGKKSFAGYLAACTGDGGRMWSPCVHVWQKGAIAYRCKTCQMTTASAVCTACFKAGGHEGHDYVMYHSESGGCCDCGDLSSWKYSGCCPAHRPPHPVMDGTRPVSELPEHETTVLRELFGMALAWMTACVERAAVMSSVSAIPNIVLPHMETPHILRWLKECCAAPQLRQLIVEEFCRPTSSLPASQTARPGLRQERLELLNRTVASLKEFLNSQIRQSVESLPPYMQRTQQYRQSKYNELDAIIACRNADASLLDRTMPLLQYVQHPCLGEITTVLMLMLYDSDFKYQFSRALGPHYHEIMAQTSSNEHLSSALDRLTVQLFSIPSVTHRLVKEEGLLEVLVDAMRSTLQQAATLGGSVDVTNPLLTKGRLHVRAMMDLRMILCHAPVALHMLFIDPTAFFMLLDCLELIQGMMPNRREAHQHVEQETTDWAAAITLDQQVSIPVGIMVGCITSQSATAEEQLPDVSAQQAGGSRLKCLPLGDGCTIDAAVASLTAAAERCLSRACTWSMSAQHPDSILSIGKELIDGAPISLHLPLHRAAGIFMQGLFFIASESSPRAAQAQAALEALRSGVWADDMPGLAEYKQSGGSSLPPRALAWQLLAVHPLSVSVWMSQIRARMWIRNGNPVRGMEMYYKSNFWHDVSIDMDYLVMQMWLAALPTDAKSQAMMAMLQAFAAHPLLRGVMSADDEEVSGPAAEPRQMDEVQLSCASAAVRLLVTLLRESHITASPRLRLRRAVIHYLAVNDQGHSMLSELVVCDQTSNDSFDAVLDEVATYQEPNLRHSGRYRLKDACWTEFDPLFIHYRPSFLQEAMERSQKAPAYAPDMQLTPQRPLPEPLGKALEILASRRVHRLAWGCLRYAQQFPSAGTQELASSALHLLAMAFRWLSNAPGEDHMSPELLGSIRRRLGDMAQGADPRCKPGLPAVISQLQAGYSDSSDLVGCLKAVERSMQSLAEQGTPADQSATQSTLADASVAGERKRDSGVADHPDSTASALEDEERRRRVRQRQTEMMRRMAAQQAAFKFESVGQGSDLEDTTSPSASPEEALQPMETGRGSSSAPVAEASAAPRHHPQGWAVPSGECVYCHLDDPDSGPLGCLVHVQVNAVPAYAARDYAQNVERLRDLVGKASGGESDAFGAFDGDGGDNNQPKAGPVEDMSTAPGYGPGAGAEDEMYQRLVIGCGPMLSEIDCRPGLAVLGCGHMMHHSCFQRFREAQEVGQSFLCPICRRLSSALLPAVCPSSSGAGKMERAPSGTDAMPEFRSLPSVGETSISAIRKLRSLPGEVSDKTSGASLSLGMAYGARKDLVSSFLQSCESLVRAPGLGGRSAMSMPPVDLVTLAADHPLGTGQDGNPDTPDSDSSEDEDVPRGNTGPESGGPAVLVQEPPHWGSGLPAGTAPRWQRSPSALAWAVLGHNLVQWELLQRPVHGPEGQGNAAGSSSSAETLPASASGVTPTSFSVTYWRSLLCLSPQAAACGASLRHWGASSSTTGSSGSDLSPDRADAALRDLLTYFMYEVPSYLQGSMYPLPPPSVPAPLGLQAMLTTRLREDALPADRSSSRLPPIDTGLSGWLSLAADPFALLLELLALAFSAVRWSPPESVLEAVLPVPYHFAVLQAAHALDRLQKGDGKLEAALEGADSPDGQRLLQEVAMQVLPFLQRAYALSATLAGRSDPPGADTASGRTSQQQVARVEEITTQLGLPGFRQVLQLRRYGQQPHRGVLATWAARSSSTLRAVGGGTATPPLTGIRLRPLMRPGLILLPQLYHHLYLALDGQGCKCYSCGKQPEDPLLCLTTGAIICCDTHGGCLYHSWTHGAGTGVFLLTKVTQLLVLRSGKRVCSNNPSLCLYLDAHGEDDPWMARGRALRLSSLRYHQISLLWSAAALDTDSGILFSSRPVAQGRRLYPIRRQLY